MTRNSVHGAHRLVVKVGASVLTDAGGGLRQERVEQLADDIIALARGSAERQIVLVSSGAIACGMARLGLAARPAAIAQLQACAAVGQGELMHHYAKAFGRHGATIAQVLLTQDDLADAARHRNARQTLLTLLHRRVIPVVNENDTVATEELTFGDNDRLAAQLACAVDAQLLVLLTDVDGLLANGKPLARVTAISTAHQALVQGGARGTTKGGMASKLAAAQVAGRRGIPTVIANGTQPGVLRQILEGRDTGTLFVPSRRSAHPKRGQAPFMTQDARSVVTAAVHAAKDASHAVATASTDHKDRALRAMAAQLRQRAAAILEANRQDMAEAAAAGLAEALLDRLMVTEARLGEMISSVEAVETLPDPVGQVIRSWRQPNGMQIEKVRVPLGVIGIIYESRPNVTSDCASLCLKSGNAAILRGGSESFRSNCAIGEALGAALAATDLPAAAITVIPVADRAGVDAMLSLDQLIDVIIPRGGESLIARIMETSRIPVIKHAKGVCHVYVDQDADLAMAAKIVVNAKCQRPSTCNAMETLLVHERVAKAFLPDMAKQLQQARVELRGDPATQALVPGISAASEEDWSTEYLALVLSVRVVPSLDAAMEHIRRYGSAHSDAIVTTNQAAADRFIRDVDSAAVFVNASTRLSDGYQFGLGAEIGISTDRLHARGPMGLEELTTYKYVVRGDGQVRQ